MLLSELPPPLDTFLRAARGRDTVALMSTLGQNAVLIDAEGEFHGDAIRAWADRFFVAQAFTVRLISKEKRNGEVVLTVMIDRGEGWRALDDRLDWRFRIEAGRILVVRVEAHDSQPLPEPVGAYVRATNSGDLDALVSTFVDDALVNDQFCDYWGKQEIQEWAARDIIGERLSMLVVNSIQHHGHIVVTAIVDGDFDKRGLPDPLVLAFYFSALDGKIVQLIILRNQSGI